MAQPEHEPPFGVSPNSGAANEASRPPVSLRLRNGLTASSLFRDAAQFGKHGSRRETFQRALLAAARFRSKQRFPGYEVLQEIGRGGMGVIYRAREAGSRRIVALKCLLHADENSDALVARFRREADMIAGLNHPNIVPVYGSGETADGLPFFAMKFASRGSLHQSRDEYRGDPRQSVRLMMEVALAVQHAHERGILHRDLKPSNILLDGDGCPLVSDFGLAQALDDSAHLTRTLAVLGTLAYMAPEQLSGRPATAANDVYSLGAVLFELLTGRPPWSGPDSLRPARDRHAVAPKLRSIARHLDRDLETICSRCLEPSPADRYRSCAALAADLQNWLSGRSISVRPLAFPARLGRRLRTDRRWAAGVCAGTISFCALVGWQVHTWKRDASIRDRFLIEHSIGVAPFIDLDELGIEPLAGKSVADSLFHKLTSFGPAAVRLLPSTATISGSGAGRIQNQGRLANTRTVLTGTMRSAGGKQRLAIRLLDSATGEPLLVRTWEGVQRPDAAAEFAKTLAGPIYQILDATDWSNLVPSKADPGLQNQTAREAILAGRELMARYTLSDLDRAINLFQKASRIAPDSSMAQTYLSFATTARTHYISDSRYLERGKTAALRAIQLSPTSGDAHRALGCLYYQEGKFSDALEQGLRAIETAGMEEKPVHFMGMLYDAMGHPDRALEWLSLAAQVKGTRGDADAQVGDCWLKLGDDERALAVYTRSTELYPDRTEGAIGLCYARMIQGDFSSARDVYRRELAGREGLGESKAIAAELEFFARNFEQAEKLYGDLVKNDEHGGGAFHGAVSYLSALGRAKIANGDTPGAKKLLQRSFDWESAAIKQQPENPEAFYRLAAVESSLGRIHQSIDHLGTAFRLGWVDHRALSRDPRFDMLRLDPAFQDILRAMIVRTADMKSKVNKLRKSDQWLPRIGMN